MNFNTLFRTKENLSLDKNTLTILRYIAIIGQFLAIGIVYYYLDLPFPILETSKLSKNIKRGSADFKKFIQEQREKLSIQRFKGLGEMNPEELWDTTLNPDNRTMLRVQYTKGTKDKSKDDQKMIEILMGDEVAPRKDFITNNALDVANLDI